MYSDCVCLNWLLTDIFNSPLYYAMGRNTIVEDKSQLLCPKPNYYPCRDSSCQSVEIHAYCQCFSFFLLFGGFPWRTQYNSPRGWSIELSIIFLFFAYSYNSLLRSIRASYVLSAMGNRRIQDLLWIILLMQYSSGIVI